MSKKRNQTQTDLQTKLIEEVLREIHERWPKLKPQNYRGFAKALKALDDKYSGLSISNEGGDPLVLQKLNTIRTLQNRVDAGIMDLGIMGESLTGEWSRKQRLGPEKNRF